MKELKVGDRVRVYSGPSEFLGVVVGPTPQTPGTVWVRIGNNETSSLWHRKQLRKIVKKERRRIFIDCGMDQTREMSATNHRLDNNVAFPWEKKAIDFNYVEFVEVRRKK